MSGFVAVAAHDHLQVLDADAVAGLATAYEAIRGPATRLPFIGEHVQAIALPAARGGVTVEQDGEDWALALGSIRPTGQLLRAPLGALEGQFALVRRTGDDFEVVADPFGIRAVYAAEGDGCTYISTSALALARYLRREADPEGIASFLRAGFVFGTQTLWSGVSRLDPAEFLRFGRDGRERGFYWRPSIDPAIRAMGFDAALNHALEIGTAERRAAFAGAPRFWADLTGGFDSRLNALLLRRAGAEFDTGTRAIDADDVRIARAIANVTGWSWTTTSLPDDWHERVAANLPIALGWGDGQLDAVNLASVLHLDAERARRHTRSVSGGLGETLRSSAAQQEFWRAGRTTRVNYDRYLDVRILHRVNANIFKRDPTPEVRDDFRTRLTAWTAAYLDEPNTTQIDLIFCYRNTGHAGAFASAAAAFLDIDTPFASKLSATAMMSMNYDHRRGHRLARTLIDRLDAQVAAIPTTWGGPAGPLRIGNAHRFAPYYARLGKRAGNKLSQKLVGRPAWRQPAVDAAGEARVRSAVLRHLGDSDGGLRYDADALGRAVPEERARLLSGASGSP